MDKSVIYTLIAAGLAAGAVLYFFLRRGPAGDAAPEPGTGFARYGLNIRLRDLFRLAVMIEEDGKAVYERLRDAASSPEAKELCGWLAGEEERHRQFAQAHLDHWRRLGPHLLEWPAFMEKVRQEGFFSDPPGKDAGELEVAAFALRQEIRSAEFYKMFEASFPDAWRKARLDRLVQEERAHEARLRAAYPSLK